MSFSWAFFQAHDVNAVLDCLRLVPRWVNFFWVGTPGGFHQDFRYVTLGKGLWIPRNIYIYMCVCVYPLVMTNIAMVTPWPIEIDGLPFLKVVIFHGHVK